jgi:alkylation response protein AidB-like acyl-CoA dehydrogenase
VRNYQAPTTDLKFVLNDVLRIGNLHHLPGFENVDDNLVSATIDGLAELAEKVVAPLNASGDRDGARLTPHGVVAAPGFVDAYREYVTGGWPALTCAVEHGGDGMPGILFSIAEEMLGGANMAFSMVPALTPGVYRVISHHAPQDVQARYLPKIVSGEWATAMTLTEPQAGSALGLITTRAEPADDGSYRVTGTKIFNSWGDHDLTDNIVHLVLARLPDAPSGTKGLSLFLVPKYLVGPDDQVGERNSFSVSSLETKMGVHASPTCVTNFEGATGYLVGLPHRGLQNMFIIMNAMRLASGVAGVGLAEAAYKNALAYTKERLAGRSPGGPQRPDLPADPIIVHPDVRRMLMTMRALVEGGRMFTFWVSLALDLAQLHPDAETRAANEALVSLLTPVVKAFLTDRASEVADIGVQCFGGHGFIRDNGAEQYVRDNRFTRLAEGTGGIQSLDLVGRKILGDDGTTLRVYLRTIQAVLDSQHIPGVTSEVLGALREVETLVEEQLPIWQSEPDTMASVSYDFLNLIGYLSLGFMWARMAGTARGHLDSGDLREAPLFYENKLRTARFYAAYLLPETATLLARIRAGSRATLAIGADEF